MRTIAITLAVMGVMTMHQAHSEIIPTQHTITAAYLWCAMVALATLAYAIRAHASRVGGLTFLRLGRLQLSFCITRN